MSRFKAELYVKQNRFPSTNKYGPYDPVHRKKYYPGREWRLVILSKIAAGSVRLNGLGGIAHDKHVNWLVDKGFATISKGRHWNGFNGYRTYITYLYLNITTKGRKHLERHTL